MSTAVMAGNPELVYSGPVPERPSDYYALCNPACNRGFIYLLSSHDGVFVYIGRSWQPGTRFDKHRRRAWWEYVSHVQIFQVEGPTPHDTYRYSHDFEQAAIQRLDPAFNIAGVLR